MGDMGRDDAPAVARNAHPDLRLTSMLALARHRHAELQGGEGEVASEGDDLLPGGDPVGEVDLPAAAELGDLFSAVELFGDAEPQRQRRIPEKAGERLDVVGGQGRLVSLEHGRDLGHDVRIVDLQDLLLSRRLRTCASG